MNIKNNIYRYIILIIVSLMHLSCNNNRAKTTQTNKEAAAKFFVDGLNKYYPWGDEYDMIINLELSENSDVIYNHLVLEDSAFLIVNDSLKEVIPKFLDYLSRAKSSKRIRDNNISVIHKYRNSQDELLYELIFLPSDYLNYKLDDEKYNNYIRSKEKQLKARIPVKLHSGTILFDVNFSPSLLEYKYKISNIDVNVDSGDLNKSIAVEDIEMEDITILEKNTSFRYVYYDKNDIYVGTIDISPDDYQHILRKKRDEDY